jgi:excisionase family DNA binding protein
LGAERGHVGQGGGSARDLARGREVAQVRGVLADRVILSSPLDPFLRLEAASQYLGLSVKTLRRAVNDRPDRALPCYRVGAVIVIKRSEADAWMAQRRLIGRPSLIAAMREWGLSKEGQRA